jgi:hypothetical protein
MGGLSQWGGEREGESKPEMEMESIEERRYFQLFSQPWRVVLEALNMEERLMAKMDRIDRSPIS